MFGAPPVGHVMGPQFKPFFGGGLWKYVCKCKYVVSTNWWLGKRKHPAYVCTYNNGEMGFTCTYPYT